MTWAFSASAGLPVQHWTQPSGARVMLIESPAIPMLDVQIDFDAGSRRDPAGKAGLASATAGMFGKGVAARAGSPALDENQIADAWADLGASFGAGAGTDRMSFTLRSLTYPDLLPRAVALAARQLAAPAFPAEVWAREQARLSAALREAQTRPATVAARTFGRLVYGGHPYGAETTTTTLAAITPQDMATLARERLHACRASVSLVGAVTRAQADAIVRELLAGLPQSPGGCAPLPAVPQVPPLERELREDIPFASAQAHVLIGQPGHRRDDPDFFPLLVGNYILGGGGFVSRLTTEVREKRGLSYSVYSYFNPGLHAGAFTVGLQTRPDQAREAERVARETLARFVAEGPTEDELRAARDNLVGGFALRIDSNRKLLDNLANINWHRLPPDYLDGWTARVEQVTAADIRRAFQRVLQPQRMVTVVVGGQP